MKKMQWSSQIWREKKSKVARFRQQVLASVQSRILAVLYFPLCMTCSQIWLIFLVWAITSVAWLHHKIGGKNILTRFILTGDEHKMCLRWEKDVGEISEIWGWKQIQAEMVAYKLSRILIRESSSICPNETNQRNDLFRWRHGTPSNNKQTNKQTKSTHHEEIKGLSDLSSLLTLETS